MKKIYIIIIGALVTILIILIIMLQFISPRATNTKPQPTPTPSYYIYPPQQIELNKREVQKINNARIMTSNESDRTQAFIEKLPLTGSDFEIGYSSLLGEFFIYKTSAAASLEVDATFEINKMSDIRKNFPKLFNEVKMPVDDAIAQKEEEIINERAK